MTETIVNILYGISFLFSLVLIGLLWWLAARRPQARLFWGLLATGWTINTLSSLIWGALAAYAAESESAFYLIDGMYAARYLFVGLALWLYPGKLPWRQLLGILVAMAAAFVVLWFAFVGPLQTRTGQTLAYLLQGTIFPLLDAGMIYLAWARWQSVKGQSLNRVMFWLALSALAYGVANWGNFWVRSIEPEASSLLVMLFWLLTDVFVFVAAWIFLRQNKTSVEAP